MATLNVTVQQNEITVNETTDQVNVTTTQQTVEVSETAFVSNADIREAITVSDTGGDGSLSYSSNTGVLTYTGPSAAEVRAHFSNTSPIQYNSSTGVIGIDENALFTGKTTDDLAQGANNMYWSTSGNAVSTTYLTEGTNLYLNGAGNSDDLTEGATNLFLTVPRWNGLFNGSIEGRGGSAAPISVTYTGGESTTDYTAELDLNDGYVQRGTHNVGRGVGVYGQGANVGVSTGNVMLELQEQGLDWANASTQSVPVFRNSDGEARKRSWASIQNEILESSERYASLNAYLSGNNNVVVNTAAANAIVVNNVNPGQGNIETVNGFFKGDGSLLTNMPQTLTNAQVVAYISTVPLHVGGNLSVTGNLDVSGNLNYQNVEDLYVTDQKITLNANATTNADVEIIANRPENTSTMLKWNETSDKWTFTNDGSTYYDIPTSTSDLAEGTNLYFTTDRANTNSDAWLTTKTTANLTEGTNLYYTEARGNATIGAYTGTMPQLRQTGNVLVLNDNQTSATDQYITVDYSNSGFNWTLSNPAIRFNRVDASSGQWEVTNDGTTYSAIPAEGGNFNVEHLSANTADIGHEIQQVYNGSGGSISKGVAVYVAGAPSGSNANISTADSDVVAKMPAIGMIFDGSINNGVAGNIMTKGITDAIIFSGEAPGTPLYVGTLGGIVTAVPDDSNVRQQVGFVIDGTAGAGNGLAQLDFSMTEHETKNTKETTYYRKFYSNAAVTNYLSSGTIGAITTGNVEIQEASVPDIYGSAGWGGGIDYIQLPVGQGYNLASGTRIRITGLPVIGANKEIGAYFNDTDWYVGTVSTEAYPLYRDPGLTLASRSGLGNFGSSFGGAVFNAFFEGTTPANITTEGFFEGDLNGAVTIDVNNNTGSGLNKGEAVYLTGGNQGDNPNVALADSDDVTKMPALGIVRENIGAGATGQVVTSGVMNNAGHGYTPGADLYIDSVAGGLTTTIPTGESKAIQKIGKVVSGNHILVQGAFRTNATPNLNSGNIFLGNTSNTSESAVLETNIVPEGANTRFKYYDDAKVTNLLGTGVNQNYVAGNLTTAYAVTGIYGSAGWGSGQDFVQLNVGANISLPAGTKISITGGASSSAFSMLTENHTFYVGADSTEAYGLYYDSALTLPSVSGLGNDLAPSGININVVGTVGANITTTGSVVAGYLHGDGSNITGLAGGSTNTTQLTQQVATTENVMAGYTFYQGTSFYGSAGWGGGQDYVQLSVGANASLASGSKVIITNAPGSMATVSNKTFWIGAESTEAYGLFTDSALTTPSVSGIANEFSTFSFYVADAANTGYVTVKGNVEAEYFIGNGSLLTGISGGGGSYGNVEVANFLDSDTMTANIEYTGNLLVGAPAANTTTNIFNVQGSTNGSLTVDSIDIGGQILADATPVSYSGATDSAVTPLNGLVFYVKWTNTDGGRFELYDDSGLTTGSTRVNPTSAFRTSGVGQVEYAGLGSSQANIQGTLNVTSTVDIATDGSNTTAGGNIITGSGSAIYVGSSGIKAQGGGTITMQSVRVTDFKANDPLGTQVYANSAISAQAPFQGSIAYVTGDRNGATGAPCYYDGSAWRYFSDDALVTT